MENVDVWNVENKYNIKEFTQYINNNPELKVRHLLDTSKDKYTLLEKYIYDTSIFHLNRLDIDNKRLENDYYIEFWCNSKYNELDNNICISCDQELKKNNIFYYPLLSCLTYFTNNTKITTFISNIDLDTYKFKDFEKQNSILLSLPKINKQITFDGHFFHGNVALIEQDDTSEFHTISINLWNKKPKNIEYYIPKYDTALSNKGDIVTSFGVDDTICKIKVSEDIINYNFFNTLLYDKYVNVCYRFNEMITTYIGSDTNSTYVLELDKSINRKAHIDKLKNTYGDVYNDYEEIVNPKSVVKYNRFLQRFQYENIYSKDMCHLIIKESELYADMFGWSTRVIDDYSIRDLSVKQMPIVSRLVYSTFDNILDIISRSYNLNTDKLTNNILFDILDVFIVKDIDDDKNSLFMYQDRDFFSFSILLNNTNDFEGNGMNFSDGLTYHLNQGDMLVYNGMTKHCATPITKGTRYLLFGYIDLKFSPTNI